MGFTCPVTQGDPPSRQAFPPEHALPTSTAERVTLTESQGVGMLHAPTWNIVYMWIWRCHIVLYRSLNSVGCFHIVCSCDYVILYVCCVCKLCIGSLVLPGDWNVFVIAWRGVNSMGILVQGHISRGWFLDVVTRPQWPWSIWPLQCIADMNIAFVQ